MPGQEKMTSTKIEPLTTAPSDRATWVIVGSAALRSA